MKPANCLVPFAATCALALAGCAPSAETEPVSTPTPSPVQTQAPRTAPVVQEVRYENYLDAPQTPGTWTYQGTASGTQAVFRSASTTHFAFNCHRNSRQIGLMRQAPNGAARVMLVRTETAARQFTAGPSQSGQNVISARLNVSDGFLDAMAITKGRIAIETEGMRTLYLPAWPEISRVIEDCR